MRPEHEVVIKEMYRNRDSIKDFREFSGKDVIEYKGYLMAASELDLMNLKILAQREREAFFLNVVLDLKQQDTADIMGISTVSVGQYVVTASQKLCRLHFPERDIPMPKVKQYRKDPRLRLQHVDDELISA